MRSSTRVVWRPLLRSNHAVWRTLEGLLDYIGEVAILLGQVLWYTGTLSFSFSNTLDQAAIIGVNSLPVVLLTVSFSGMVLSLYTASQLAQMSFGNLVGGLVGVAMAREVAPTLTAVTVAARAGSAIAAEIGSMKVTEQIDALRALAVSPIEYLVVPRFVSTVLMMPVLTVLAGFVGSIGAYWVATAAGISAGSFESSIQTWVRPEYVTTGLLKTLVFGMIIALVSCHQGLRARGGAAGVGRATTNAVVLSTVFVYAADFMMVSFLFGPGTGAH